MRVGADVTDFVIVLNTPDAVKAFSRGENLTLGGNLSGDYSLEIFQSAISDETHTRLHPIY